MGGYLDLALLTYETKTDAEAVQEQWAALVDFYKAGKVRSIGVRNFNNEIMDALLQSATIAPMVHEIEYHAGMGDDPNGLVSHARKHGIQLKGHGPLLDPQSYNVDPYASIGLKHNRSGTQVAFKWLHQHDPPVAYVVSSRYPDVVNSGLDGLSKQWELTADEMATISHARLVHVV